MNTKAVNLILNKLEEVSVITKKIDELEDFIISSQETLREFVTDKTYGLDVRFDIWKNYCNKEHSEWVIDETEFGLIGTWVQHLVACYDYYEKGRTFDWEYFLGWVEENLYDEKWGTNREEMLKDISSVDDFKEILIQTNFGSFINDW